MYSKFTEGGTKSIGLSASFLQNSISAKLDQHNCFLFGPPVRQNWLFPKVLGMMDWPTWLLLDGSNELPL